MPKKKPPPPRIPAEVASTAEVLGDPVRTEMLRALVREPMTVRQLCEELDRSDSEVRRHLALLESLALVTGDTEPEMRAIGGRGRETLWRADRQRAKTLGEGWLKYLLNTRRSPRRRGT